MKSVAGAAPIGSPARQAWSVAVRGVVQGVGFRPLVYRLAARHRIAGWVLNGERGVEIHAEGDAPSLRAFVAELQANPPAAARIASVERRRVAVEGFAAFEIRESERRETPSVRVCSDLPACDACLRELFDPGDRRYRYPYVNCTDCGPRYSIVRGLPYDRPLTTMRDWPMCAQCAREYADPLDRRFHAQPVACPQCGPAYALESGGEGVLRGYDAIVQTAAALRGGAIVGIKGIGGYHLACDARNPRAVAALRERKFRKERPFAVMVRSCAGARELVSLDERAEALLRSQARPIVLAPATADLDGVAPGNAELGVMLAYAPLHHLLFDAGAPRAIVMTSGNRSSEPIAYRDDDARERLAGIADALLVGEREIARRVDDSVARAGAWGVTVLRHSRGYAPQSVAELPAGDPILAVGADLKNAVALVVRGQAFVSQHVGDLEHLDALDSFKSTVAGMLALYEVDAGAVTVAHDAHPEYASSQHARTLAPRLRAVQHHRAHVASVLAERGAFETPVLGFAFDGTGYGEDGTIWGGEIFSGTLAGGLQRVAHLRSARLPGGDAAARFPVQAAAGFLLAAPELHDLCDFEAEPFSFPPRFCQARELLEKNVRTFATTSMGRLFDTAAALLGFTRPITFEGQAAMWLEHLATQAPGAAAYPFPFDGRELDYAPLLAALVRDRLAKRDVRRIAAAFHAAVARAVVAACDALAPERVVVSGGVFQNAVLNAHLHERLGERLWTNRSVPPNDGGICLGQAAIASFPNVEPA